MNKLVSIVTPVFNEEENVEDFHSEVAKAIEPLSTQYRFEFVFTDNHSTDSTFEKLKRIARSDNRVRVLRFSRNFGYQKSIMAGYLSCGGEAAIQLDCDLQDPPEMIALFLREWERGYRVVYGVRKTRQEPIVINLARRAFYRLLNSISPHPLPPDAGDFRLVDRRIIEELRNSRDANPYIRGRIALLGFAQLGVPYDRRARRRGTSKFSALKLAALAVDAIVNHSVVPLRLATLLGVVTILGCLAGIGFAVVGKVFFGGNWPGGFATLTVLILLGIGVQSLILGIMGEYVARIYEQLKMSPDAIVEERFPPDSSEQGTTRNHSQTMS